MDRVNVSNERTVYSIFYVRKFRWVKVMNEIVEKFKISLIEDGKSPKKNRKLY